MRRYRRNPIAGWFWLFFMLWLFVGGGFFYLPFILGFFGIYVLLPMLLLWPLIAAFRNAGNDRQAQFIQRKRHEDNVRFRDLPYDTRRLTDHDYDYEDDEYFETHDGERLRVIEDDGKMPTRLTVG